MTGTAPQDGDPMWNTRRTIMSRCLYFCAGFLVFALLFPAEKIVAMAGLATAIAGFAAFVITAYMGIAEYGRVKGVLGSTETKTIDAPPGGPIKQTTVMEPTPPIVAAPPVPSGAPQ